MSDTLTTRCGREIKHAELVSAIKTLHKTLNLSLGYMWVTVGPHPCFPDQEEWRLESPEHYYGHCGRYVATGMCEGDLWSEIFKIQQGINLFRLYNL